jgi:glycosyltransferase involved in cell wall biosynthesis
VTRAVFAIPGDLATPTGGYAYARRMLELLPREGIATRRIALPGSYPDPSAADLAGTAELMAAAPPDAVLLIDGLAYGAMPADLIEGFRRPVVALVHHPLGLEAGLTPDRRAALLASEAAALGLARRIVVTSPLTGRLLASDFNVDAAVIAVAEPGTDPVGRSRGTGSPVHILAVGAITPRKGFDVLVAALAQVPDRNWHLTIAGSADRDPKAAAALRASIVEAGLSSRVTLAGALEPAALDLLYEAADIFVSPSLFEGYGMALAEALARGLPIVASTGGAAAETVPDGAAIKIPPGDIAELTAALTTLIAAPALRAAFGDAAWHAGRTLPRWTDTAARIAKVLKEVALERV